MGKGIAVGFVKNFGGRKELESQNCDVTEVAYLKRDERYIFYMITKLFYYNIRNFNLNYKLHMKIFG